MPLALACRICVIIKWVLLFFRDWTVNRVNNLINMKKQKDNGDTINCTSHENEDLVFVALSGYGQSEVINEKVLVANNATCTAVTAAIESIQRELGQFLSYKVRCGGLASLSFEDEVSVAQSAKIWVTRDGTMSMSTLFVRDNTEVIIYSIRDADTTATEPDDEWKEYNIQAFTTFSHFVWTPLLKYRDGSFILHDIKAILLQALWRQHTFLD